MKYTHSPLPRSPFSTRLSGSAREVELRIQNIVQGPKRRPPILLLALTAAAILLCGGLVSCQPREPKGELTQYPLQELGEGVRSLRYEDRWEALVQDVPPDPDREPDLAPGSASHLVIRNLSSGAEWVEERLDYGSADPEWPTAALFPFSGFMGCDGFIFRHQADSAHMDFDFYALRPEGLSLLLRCSNALWRGDLDGDGREELLACDWYQDQVSLYRQGEDGQVWGYDPTDAVRRLMGLPEGAPVKLTLQTDGTLAAAPAEGGAWLEEQLLDPAQLLAETLALLAEPADLLTVRGLNLDGVGGEDDSLTVTNYKISETHPDGLTAVTAKLGDGPTLLWEYPYSCYPRVLPLFLTSPDRQSLVLEMADRTSNYGAAGYFILEVKDGRLTELAHIGLWDGPDSGLLPDDAVVSGAEGADREDSPLQALRAPVLIDKWHAPCYYTLTWDGARFSAVSDEYFTDKASLPLVGGRELTLELTGRWHTDDLGRRELYHDRIQVYDGDILLQTITPQFPLSRPRAFDADTAAQVTPPKANYPSFGFSAEYSLHGLDIRDVNFDGCADLGLPCDTTNHDVHAWYLWNESSRQLEYSFALQGDLAVDQERELLIENRWEEGPHFYYFNAYGQLVWLGPDGP